ncbi:MULTISPECIES: endonuclease MutS2 [Anaerococcus]|uniref:Endonuclease MutS2 n=1 Tax=Anaerococcus octavius TaxID=54007 RepID=A0A2I1MAJ1_9FIRM|nr:MULTISPECIES: endonuclease MutS2 [Anaerococcus]MBS6105634.1 endonuclease MutS2 [Anaerococcus sp.]PKZ17132.1 endonuclease MutS2 [Anaerococcus octavius]
MQERTLEVLEYEKILEKVASQARSSVIKNKILNLAPMTDADEIKEELENTAQMVGVISRFGNIDLFGLYDFTAMIGYVRKRGILEPYELLQVNDLLRVSEYLKNYGKDIEEVYIKDLFSRISTNDFIKKEIERSIISEDEIADNASSELRNIRRQKARKEADIKAKLNSYISSDRYDDALQDKVVSIRDGRYVVPVKTNKKSVIGGIIHDKSSSGNTLFVEPAAIVELNNQLKDLELKEEDEIRRILDRLSRFVEKFDVEILENQKLIGRIDFLAAKAKFAINNEYTKPKITTDKIIKLNQARHPLLTGKVVPIDVIIGGDYKTLIITGPNTGGKTVSLKTVGLISLMAQTGFYIPAEENSIVNVFDDIFVDIGDTQSLEMSLSTFSASLTKIVGITENASPNSLVLLDELGSGTDPSEGAALAISILDYLRKKEIMTFATTHYSELKYYAVETDGVMNASVEFDVNTLSPTYKLKIGTPGKSNAFEISRRLGLDESILKSAQNLLGEDTKNVNKILDEIEESKEEIQAKNAEIDRYKLQIQKAKRDLEEKSKEVEKQRAAIIIQAEDKANEILEKANTESQEMLKEAKKSKNANTSDIDRSLNNIRNKYKSSKIERKQKGLRIGKSDDAPEDLKLGDIVIIEGINERAEVISEPDNKGNIKLQMGILKMDSNIKNVTKIEGDSKTEKNIQKVYNAKKAMNISPTLDLRGQRYDDAMRNLDKYLDDAMLAGLSKAKIIHGKGTGALINGVTENLKNDKRIADFRLGDDKEGGYGVTIVSFD